MIFKCQNYIIARLKKTSEGKVECLRKKIKAIWRILFFFYFVFVTVNGEYQFCNYDYNYLLFGTKIKDSPARRMINYINCIDTVQACESPI